MEKQPSFDRIIGGTESDKLEIRELAEQASLKSGKELYGKYLVEPTTEEKIATEEAVEYSNKIASHYGASRKVNLQKIHILKNGGVKTKTKADIAGGLYNSFNQSIAVDRRNSPALTAMAIVHESLHATSYQAEQILKDAEVVIPYRSGLEMTGRKGEGKYFGVAQEAIIATLSKIFFDRVICGNPRYDKEIEYTEKLKAWLLEFLNKHLEDKKEIQQRELEIKNILILPFSQDLYNVVFNSNEDEGHKFNCFKNYFKKQQEVGDVVLERAEEREKFDKTLDRMIADAHGQLGTKKDLFDQFAQAHFTGNYLSLAKMVEKTLGNGSFRKIAIELGEMKTAKAGI